MIQSSKFYSITRLFSMLNRLDICPHGNWRQTHHDPHHIIVDAWHIESFIVRMDKIW